MTTLIWDPRLTQRGAIVTLYQPVPGELYWKLIEARWLDLEAGKHHILVDVVNEYGQRLPGIPVRFDNGGSKTSFTEAKPGDEWAVDFPMYAAGYGYSVRVDGMSDMVSHLGLGTIETPHQGDHTGYFFRFQLTVGQGPQPAPTPNLTDELNSIITNCKAVEHTARMMLSKYGGAQG